MLKKTLIKWLEKKKYDYFYDFPLGGKFPDVIALKDKELIAFECEKRTVEIPAAMGNCLFYLNDANKVFIVLPEKEKDFLSKSAIETLRGQGIGLMIGDHKKINILVGAKEFRRNNSQVIAELRRKNIGLSEEAKKEIDIKKKIVEILKEHPEGLKILDIAKYVGSNRVTVAKYVYGLTIQGLIFQRLVGPSKLCYLKGDLK